MKQCLHQFIRPTRRSIEKVNGEGECIDCETNSEENKKCKKYIPINITVEDFGKK